jgi:AcrR family transcriptional regulator
MISAIHFFRPMPKLVDHDKYRKELLMKSFDLFAQKGYSSITMRQLAQGLGVSTGTLYHYFPNKEALFWQLVEQQTQQDILDFLTEAGGLQTLPERIEALINFVAKNEDYFLKQTSVWVDFCQQQERKEIMNHETLRRANGEIKQTIADYLQIQDKEIANFILTFFNGLILARLFEGEIISFQEQGTLLKKMLLAYLGRLEARN